MYIFTSCSLSRRMGPMEEEEGMTVQTGEEVHRNLTLSNTQISGQSNLQCPSEHSISQMETRPYLTLTKCWPQNHFFYIFKTCIIISKFHYLDNLITFLLRKPRLRVLGLKSRTLAKSKMRATPLISWIKLLTCCPTYEKYCRWWFHCVELHNLQSCHYSWSG